VTAGALTRVIRRPSPVSTAAAAAAERCDLCGSRVGPSPANQPGPQAGRHRHVLDLAADEPRCVCRACLTLFDRDGAGGAQLRLVPTRYERLPALPPDVLGVPVGLLFVVVDDGGRALAQYPSPIGATRHEIDPPAWAAARAACPALATLQPRVEALLIDTARGADERWIVPIDACFRLVAVLRREWTGLSGGSTVHPAIREFFAALPTR